LVDAQTIGVLVTATSVSVAAIYYIFTLRINMKAREMEIAHLCLSETISDEGLQRFATVMTMEGKNAEDFMEKYGYLNPEMFGKWTSQLFSYETRGILLKSKVVDAEKLYVLGGYGAIRIWEKYKDIIKYRRDAEWGQDYMSNFEFYAGEMMKIKMKRDASFKDKLEAYSRTMES